MLTAAWDGDVGPLQALVDELEFNKMVTVYCSHETKRGALFQNTQFHRAIQEGMIAILKDPLKKAILAVYVAISRANQHIIAEANQDVKMQFQGSASIRARDAIAEAAPLIRAASGELANFLSNEVIS